ncbi:MAG: hypothetical protein ACLQF1_03650 [Methyloceanibacter sp.]|jgi:hypothetical protein
MTYITRRYGNAAQWFSCRDTAQERVQSIVEKAVVRLNGSVLGTDGDRDLIGLRIGERYGRAI